MRVAALFLSAFLANATILAAADKDKPELKVGHACAIHAPTHEGTWAADARSGLQTLAKLVEAIADTRSRNTQDRKPLSALHKSGDAFLLTDLTPAKVVRVGQSYCEVEFHTTGFEGRRGLVLKEWVHDPAVPEFKAGDRVEIRPYPLMWFYLADARGGDEAFDKLRKAGTDFSKQKELVPSGDVFKSDPCEGKVLRVTDEYYEVQLTSGRKALAPIEWAVKPRPKPLDSFPTAQRAAVLAQRKAAAKKIADEIRKEAKEVK